MPTLQENIEEVAKYYAKLAPEYDHLAEFEKRSASQILVPLREEYQSALRGRRVLEIACGTGNWTGVLAEVCESVLATDVNPEMLETTRRKLQSAPNVRYQLADAYSLSDVEQGFSGAFAHFWWSHVPRKKAVQFLETLHSHLEPGAVVLFVDSLHYPGKRRVDEHGDTYEERSLRDGRSYETIKNFPTEQELRALIDGKGEVLAYREHPEHVVWSLLYKLN